MCKLSISIYGKSIVGNRDYQQDAFYVSKSNNMAIVCDGMGGLSGGEAASKCVVEYMEKLDIQDFFACEKNIQSKYLEVANKLNGKINLLEDNSGTRMEGGTTIVVANIFEDRLYWMSIGDSKLYIIRNGELRALTREHNYRLKLDGYLSQGYIDEKDYLRESERAEALISYLGIGKLEIIDISEQPLKLEKDDVLVMCSDGLYKAMSERQILAVVEENFFDAEMCTNELINMSQHLVKGKLDNTTVIVIKCE